MWGAVAGRSRWPAVAVARVTRTWRAASRIPHATVPNAPRPLRETARPLLAPYAIPLARPMSRVKGQHSIFTSESVALLLICYSFLLIFVLLAHPSSTHDGTHSYSTMHALTPCSPPGQTKDKGD